MELPNRKQRRLWAKESGLLEKKRRASFKEQLEISKRAADAGRQIHNHNLEKMLREIDAKDQERELKKIEFLISQGMTPEEALEAVKSKSD